MTQLDPTGSLSARQNLEKLGMPATPPSGYILERPCSTTPDGQHDDKNNNNNNYPSLGYTRQNPFGLAVQQPSAQEPMSMRGGGKNGGFCEGLLAGCCCCAMCDICC